MKLINIINSYGEADAVPRFYLKADTALLRNNDAFYIPDLLGRIVAEPHIVLKVLQRLLQLQPQQRLQLQQLLHLL